MRSHEGSNRFTRLSMVEPERLVRAAKTAIATANLVHDILWRVYPDELLLLSEESEDLLVRVLLDGLEERFPSQE